MTDDPFPGIGLRPIALADQPIFRSYFDSLTDPLSDYTFSQIYTWRNSLHLAWKILAGHLCVFANGTGDLTLLVPPIGDGNSEAAMAESFELMDDYNAARKVPERSRIEYASEELLHRFDRSRLNVSPMGTDYVYDTQRMIDLAGGDLASKRQAKNRFTRLYPHHVETYDCAKHLSDCQSLLAQWRVHQDAQHLEEPNCNSIKRQKETIAAELALQNATELGLQGMVVYCEKRLIGFTFGERLGADQCSIVIEKTDLEFKGLAQFIFSEFCQRHWSDRPLCNVGDDWGLETLAWTKMSYRPVKLLQKYLLTPIPKVAISITPPPATIRPAGKSDLLATADLENACFNSTVRLKKRQLQYLQQRKSAVFLIAEKNGAVVGEGISLVRQNKKGRSGRIYSLAVNENSRGEQIGRRLLKSMLAELAERGVTRVYLEVEQSNIGAIALYEQNGFRRIGTMPDYYGENRDGLHMVYEIPVSAPQTLAA